MKALRTSVLAAAAAGLLIAAPVSAKTTPVAQSNTATKVDDHTLATRIDARLEAIASLKKYGIGVAVKDGVATLTGKVRTEADKVRAGREAKVPGVTRVENQITLDKDAGKPTTTDKAVDKTKQAVATAADKTKEGLSTAADKTKEGLSKTGEVITDSWITTKVHAKFIDEALLKGSDIKVDTKDHAVTLRGTVKTQAGRDRAVAIAKGTEGVTRVTDALTIK